MTKDRVFECRLKPRDRERVVRGIRDIALADIHKWLAMAAEVNDDVLHEMMLAARVRLERHVAS